MLRSRLALFAAIVLAAQGCGKGPAYGSDNAIIAVVDPTLREALEPVIRRSFERPFFTTRDEPVFEVTVVSTESIGDFRRWKRILVIEPAGEDARLAGDLLGRDQREAARAGGVVAEVSDRWARGQTIWVVAGPDGPATAVLARARIDSLFDVVHGHWVDFHVGRMWASGPDEALADSLLRQLGFSIAPPRVYRAAPASAPDSTRTWYSEDPRRVISLHWTALPAVVTPDTVLALRRAWGSSLFPGDTIPASVPAAADTAPEGPPLQVSETSLGGQRAIRLQGVWQNPADRTAGVFLSYAVPCGGRLVLLDGNLFAPERAKVPFVIQLERIFETFRCGGGG